MSNTVLPGRVYQIYELYIDDVLIHGWDLVPFLHNERKVFEKRREFDVALDPAKSKLGLAEVERMLRHIFCGETVREPTG